MYYCVVLSRPDSRGHLKEALAAKLRRKDERLHTNLTDAYDEFGIAMSEISFFANNQEVCMIAGERLLDGGSGTAFAQRFKAKYPKGIFILFTQFSLDGIDTDNPLIDAVIAQHPGGNNPFETLAEILVTHLHFIDVHSLKREHPALLLRHEVRVLQERKKAEYRFSRVAVERRS